MLEYFKQREKKKWCFKCIIISLMRTCWWYETLILFCAVIYSQNKRFPRKPKKKMVFLSAISSTLQKWMNILKKSFRGKFRAGKKVFSSVSYHFIFMHFVYEDDLLFYITLNSIIIWNIYSNQISKMVLKAPNSFGKAKRSNLI